MISAPCDRVIEQPVAPDLGFDEIIPSWNVSLAPQARLKIEIKVPGQKDWLPVGGLPLSLDSSPSVRDLIHLPGLVRQLKVRITLKQPGPGQSILRLVAFSFSNSKFFGPSPAANHSAAWGQVEKLPSVSKPSSATELLLRYWSDALGTPNLYSDLAMFTRLTTGHPSLEVAYAGGLGTMLAYRTRATALQDVESWTQRSVPVLCDLGQGNTARTVIVVGFSLDGDPVVIDPSRSFQPTATPRKMFERDWLQTKRTLTMILPWAVYTPPDTKGIFLHGHPDPSELKGNPGIL